MVPRGPRGLPRAQGAPCSPQAVETPPGGRTRAVRAEGPTRSTPPGDAGRVWLTPGSHLVQHPVSGPFRAWLSGFPHVPGSACGVPAGRGTGPGWRVFLWLAALPVFGNDTLTLVPPEDTVARFKRNGLRSESRAHRPHRDTDAQGTESAIDLSLSEGTPLRGDVFIASFSAEETNK